MEIQKGKGNLERMVAQWQEDEDNKRWINDKTKACPGCGVRVEKRSVVFLQLRPGTAC